MRRGLRRLWNLQRVLADVARLQNAAAAQATREARRRCERLDAELCELERAELARRTQSAPGASFGHLHVAALLERHLQRARAHAQDCARKEEEARRRAEEALRRRASTGRLLDRRRDEQRVDAARRDERDMDELRAQRRRAASGAGAHR